MSDEQQEMDIAVLKNDVAWIKGSIDKHAEATGEAFKATNKAIADLSKKLDGVQAKDNAARWGAIGSGIGTALVAWFSQFGGHK